MRPQFSRIPVRWIRWRRYRYQGLLATQPEIPAHDIAKREALCRWAIGKILGPKTAERATLLMRPWGEQTQFTLIIAAGKLAAGEIDRLGRIPGLAIVQQAPNTPETETPPGDG